MRKIPQDLRNLGLLSPSESYITQKSSVPIRPGFDWQSKLMNEMQQAPWHERWKTLGEFRNRCRNQLFGVARQMSATEDGRQISADMLRGLLQWRPEEDLLATAAPPPYPELGQAPSGTPTCLRSDPIFITARFRSGSTFLWNLFRNMDGYTSYYEPFNERRWFDPAARGERIDATHKNVAENYWQEYEGLTELGHYFDAAWHDRQLYMDAGSWNPRMKRYVELMIEKAPGRPVLQFNRIDLRLPWFRRTFPNAKILHLYRHPRDQWCSALMDLKCFPKDGRMSEFAPHDKFYLRVWASDLKYHFPFLDENEAAHPYQLFYFVWKLSYLFGLRDAHHSVAYEHLVQDPQAELARLFPAVGVATYDFEKLNALVAKPDFGKWKKYADDDWFRSHESHCEAVLAEFLCSHHRSA